MQSQLYCVCSLLVVTQNSQDLQQHNNYFLKLKQHHDVVVSSLHTLPSLQVRSVAASLQVGSGDLLVAVSQEYKTNL